MGPDYQNEYNDQQTLVVHSWYGYMSSYQINNPENNSTNLSQFHSCLN